MSAPIIGSGNPVGSATASAGGSMMTNARLRSATARAADVTPWSQIPGVRSRLKIGILSSAFSGSNASAKSPGLKDVNGVVGRLSSSGVAPSAAGHAVGYAVVGATVTSDETGEATVPRRASSVFSMSWPVGAGLRVTRRNVSARPEYDTVMSARSRTPGAPTGSVSRRFVIDTEIGCCASTGSRPVNVMPFATVPTVSEAATTGFVPGPTSWCHCGRRGTIHAIAPPFAKNW